VRTHDRVGQRPPAQVGTTGRLARSLQRIEKGEGRAKSPPFSLAKRQYANATGYLYAPWLTADNDGAVTRCRKGQPVVYRGGATFAGCCVSRALTGSGTSLARSRLRPSAPAPRSPAATLRRTGSKPPRTRRAPPPRGCRSE